MVLFENRAVASGPDRAHSIFSLPEGLRFYVVRSDGSMIPLVPADQLPFQVQGVPRQLNHQQLSKGNWAWIADTIEPAYHLSVQHPAHPASESLPSSRFLPPDYNVRTGSAEQIPLQRHDNTQGATNIPASFPEESIVIQHWNGPDLHDQPKSLIDSIADIYQKDAQRLGYTPRTLPPSGVEPDLSKKEYCSYWIRTGDCAFTSQGCRYKHEMPPLDKLREIGFTSVPKWWKEKSALRGPTWIQRRMQEERHEECDQTTSALNQSAVHKNFRSAEQESSHTIFKREPEHSTVSEEMNNHSMSSPGRCATRRISDLIDLESSVPLPSPRSSTGPATISDAGPDAWTDTPYIPSSLQANSPTPVLLQRSPAPSPSPIVSRPIPPNLPPNDQHTGRFLRRHSEISQSSSNSEMSNLTPKSKIAPQSAKKSPPKPSKKSGLAKSKHAMKAKDTNTEQSKPTHTKQDYNAPAPIELEKEITKLVRDQHRREKKR